MQRIETERNRKEEMNPHILVHSPNVYGWGAVGWSRELGILSILAQLLECSALVPVVYIEQEAWSRDPELGDEPRPPIWDAGIFTIRLNACSCSVFVSDFPVKWYLKKNVNFHIVILYMINNNISSGLLKLSVSHLQFTCYSDILNSVSSENGTCEWET